MIDWTRREFLAASALAATAQDVSKVAVPPSEKIVLGFIGTGGMGTGPIDTFKGFPQVAIAAVCDVHEPHRLRALEKSGAKPETYGDFRRVLDRKDIDAVVIATPHHWHAIIAIRRLARPAKTSIARSRWATASRRRGPW